MDEIVLPATPPDKILRMLTFYKARREAAERILPQPVPQEISHAATEIWNIVSAQAYAASEAGAAEVAVRIPVTPDIKTALLWRVENEKAFDEIMIGELMVDGYNDQWERDYAMFKYFMHSAAEQVS